MNGSIDVVLIVPFAMSITSFLCFALPVIYWNFTAIITTFSIAVCWTMFVSQVYWASYGVISAMEYVVMPRRGPDNDAYMSLLAYTVLYACYAGRTADAWTGAIATRLILSVWLERASAWISLWAECNKAQKLFTTLTVLVITAGSFLQWSFYATQPIHSASSKKELRKDYFMLFTSVSLSLILAVRALSYLVTCLMHAFGYNLVNFCFRTFSRGRKGTTRIIDSCWDPTSQEFAICRDITCALADLYITWVYLPAGVTMMYQLCALRLCFNALQGWSKWTTFQSILSDIPLVEAPAAESCGVCLEDFTEGEQVRRLPCGHSFHGPCVRQWLMQNRKCPLCRHATSRSESSPLLGQNGDGAATTTTAVVYTDLRRLGSGLGSFVGTLQPLVPRLRPAQRHPTAPQPPGAPPSQRSSVAVPSSGASRATPSSRRSRSSMVSQRQIMDVSERLRLASRRCREARDERTSSSHRQRRPRHDGAGLATIAPDAAAAAAAQGTSDIFVDEPLVQTDSVAAAAATEGQTRKRSRSQEAEDNSDSRRSRKEEEEEK